jgi:hypothetical protein
MKGKLRLLQWVGIVVLFLPFFGVPDWLRTTLTIVIGLVLIYLAYSLRFAYKKLKFELRPQAEPASDIHHG